jgi:SAM-dependent methyltransferase
MNTSSPAARGAARLAANYGIDAPGLVLQFALLGFAGFALAWAAPHLFANHPAVMAELASSGVWVGASFLCTALGMVAGSKFWKLRFREKLVESLALAGTEKVLDVGCGRGLLLNALARRLPRGKAVGVDLWQTEDQSGNCVERTLENAEREGVRDRVELHTGDMRKMPFADATFDAITASWSIHNIYDAAGRADALREVVRVLKPGGKVALTDIKHAREYARVLTEAGMKDVKISRPNFVFVIPSHVVRARKPV